jgi:hypothetical protein
MELCEILKGELPFMVNGETSVFLYLSKLKPFTDDEVK